MRDPFALPESPTNGAREQLLGGLTRGESLRVLEQSTPLFAKLDPGVVINELNRLGGYQTEGGA